METSYENGTVEMINKCHELGMKHMFYFGGNDPKIFTEIVKSKTDMMNLNHPDEFQKIYKNIIKKGFLTKMKKRLVCVILCAFVVSQMFTACKKEEGKATEVKPAETTFHMIGNWDAPPVYNGNPFAPGGVGFAKDFIYGALAIYHSI